MTYTLRIDKQGVKQLKALLRFTPPAGDKRRQLDAFGIAAEGILACDTFALGIAGINKGIYWHTPAPETTLAVNAKSLINMLPANGGTVTIEGTKMTISAPQYEAQGVLEDGEWLKWRTLVPEVDHHAPLFPVGAFNPTLVGKFGALADALAGKPRQAVKMLAYHPVAEVKPMLMKAEDDSLLGLVMPMRLS
jgi:hypothetical protein